MVQPYPDRDVDTLKGSSFSNMKELRFNADDGVWRVAFALLPLTSSRFTSSWG